MDENTSKVFDDALADSLIGMGSPPSEPGSSLFVINLCASMAPFPTANKTLPGLESYRLYQVTRREDGRTRYRLRLGFFTSEADAEAVLATVREQHPTAFTTCLCEEDKRFTRGYVPAEQPKRPIAVVPAPITASTPPAAPTPKSPPAPQVAKAEIKPAAAKPAAPSHIEVKPIAPKAEVAPAPAKQTVSAADLAFLEELTWEPPALTPAANAPVHTEAAPAKPVSKKAPTPASEPVAKQEAKPNQPSTVKAELTQKPATPKAPAAPSVAPIELTFSDPPAPAAKPPAPAADNKPFHVGKGVDIPASALNLQLESTPTAAAKAAAPASAAPISKPAAKPAAPSAPAMRSTPAPATKPTNAPVAKSAANPDLDSTQTIRALTSAEMNDESLEKWFAIQLAASEQPVNLDAMPHLDIFEAYRLYSVASAGSGKIIHSLRLGFFKEAVSAEAVSGYLKTFFNSPSVLRISVAEHARFKDAPTPGRPAHSELKPDAKIVDLKNARTTKPAVPPSIPTVTMEVVPSRKDTSATGSFKMDNSCSFNINATGSFKTTASGSHKALTPSLKPAAKSARPPTKRSEPLNSKHSSTGKFKAVKKSLSEELMDEARNTSLSESAIRKLPKNDSLLSRLFKK